MLCFKSKLMLSTTANARLSNSTINFVKLSENDTCSWCYVYVMCFIVYMVYLISLYVFIWLLKTLWAYAIHDRNIITVYAYDLHLDISFWERFIEILNVILEGIKYGTLLWIFEIVVKSEMIRNMLINFVSLFLEL